MDDAPVMHVTDLVCGYAGRDLFAPVSFRLTAGQALRIAGANGQGKTTLLRAIAGLTQPLAGRVAWHGHAEFAASVGLIAHENGLNAALTPGENLDLLLHLSGCRTDAAQVGEALTQLGLRNLQRRLCGRLSAGQRRRVALARLWLEHKQVWLLDEPAAALDVDARALLCRRIAALVRQGGMVIFSTHEELSLPDVSPQVVQLQPC